MGNLFPILVNIKNKKCIVVGGGCVAERKVKTLLKYGAQITLISPEITDNLRKIVEKGKIKHIKRQYKKGDTKGAFLVIPATSDSKINTQIAKEAKFLINVVERNKKSKNGKEEIQKNINGIVYTVPAIFEKGNLTITVSTEFPALSRLLKNEISTLYGKEFALYLKYLKKFRKEIQRKISDNKKRQNIFRKIASKKIVSILQQNGFKKAKEEIEKIINEI